MPDGPEFDTPGTPRPNGAPAPALRLRAVEHAFGRGESLALGVEEELLLVDPRTLALDHRASELLPRLDGAAGAGPSIGWRWPAHARP